MLQHFFELFIIFLFYRVVLELFLNAEIKKYVWHTDIRECISLKNNILYT